MFWSSLASLKASCLLLLLAAEHKPLCHATNTVMMESKSSASSLALLLPALMSELRTMSCILFFSKIHSTSSIPKQHSQSFLVTTTLSTAPMCTHSRMAAKPLCFQLSPEPMSLMILWPWKCCHRSEICYLRSPCWWSKLTLA